MTRTSSTTKRRRRGHAAAGSRILVGGLATSATLGIAGILAAPANQAAVVKAIPTARARISLAPPKRVRPPTIATRATSPAPVARVAASAPSVTAASQPIATAAPVVRAAAAPAVTAPPATAPPAAAPPVSVSTAS